MRRCTGNAVSAAGTSEEKRSLPQREPLFLKKKKSPARKADFKGQPGRKRGVLKPRGAFCRGRAPPGSGRARSAVFVQKGGTSAMDLELCKKFIQPELLALVPALNFLGTLLKRSRCV